MDWTEGATLCIGGDFDGTWALDPPPGFQRFVVRALPGEDPQHVFGWPESWPIDNPEAIRKIGVRAQTEGDRARSIAKAKTEMEQRMGRRI